MVLYAWRPRKDRNENNPYAGRNAAVAGGPEVTPAPLRAARLFSRVPALPANLLICGYRKELFMAVKAAKAPVRGRGSKAEGQQEFAEIQEQVEQSRESSDPKGQESARLRETEVRQAADAVTVEGVVQRISELGLDVTRALSDLSAKLSEEVQLLAAVRETVALERKEIGRAHV